MNTSRSWVVPAVIIGVVVLLGFYMVGKYNTFVKQNEAVNTQWAQVESQYQRRFDLIPNLVSSVQGVMKQEQTVFGDLAEARTRYSGATTPDQKATAAGQVETSLGRLIAVMENYPQLQSSGNVRDLMAELSGTENRVAVERMRYNEVVRDYNVMVKTFPNSFVAGMFGFGPRAMFEAAEGAENAPKVTL